MSDNSRGLIKVCAAVMVAFAAANAMAGVKYWDNPEYKAYDVGDYVQSDLIFR